MLTSSSSSMRLPTPPRPCSLVIIDHLNPEGLPSLRQDVLARRPTEVELFSGTINRLGAAHGIPTPQNERFYAAIKELESSFS